MLQRNTELSPKATRNYFLPWLHRKVARQTLWEITRVTVLLTWARRISIPRVSIIRQIKVSYKPGHMENSFDLQQKQDFIPLQTCNAKRNFEKIVRNFSNLIDSRFGWVKHQIPHWLSLQNNPLLPMAFLIKLWSLLHIFYTFTIYYNLAHQWTQLHLPWY